MCHEDEKVYTNFSSKFYDPDNADPPISQTSHDELPQKEFEATPPSGCFLRRQRRLILQRYILGLSLSKGKPRALVLSAVEGLDEG